MGLSASLSSHEIGSCLLHSDLHPQSAISLIQGRCLSLISLQSRLSRAILLAS